MTDAKNLGCGRLDKHDEHDWTRHPHHAGTPGPLYPERTYHCGGDVIVEGGHWVKWDALDDAREDELDRQIRDGLANWGRSA